MKAEFDRSKGIGGSDATRLYEGDWYQLWSEKTGETQTADLSKVLPVQMGRHTESFNIHWYEQETGNVVKDQQKYFQMDKYPHIYAHIDGVAWAGKYKEGLLECKHTNAFNNSGKVVNKYAAQIQHYLMVTKEKKAFLSVIYGNMKYDITEVEANEEFQNKLLAAEILFWYYVENKKAPPDLVSWSTFKDLGKRITQNGSNKKLISLLSRVQ